MAAYQRHGFSVVDGARGERTGEETRLMASEGDGAIDESYVVVLKMLKALRHRSLG